MDMAQRVTKVETEVKNLKDRNTSEHAEIKNMLNEGLKDLKETVNGFMKSADKRFAPKRTQIIVDTVSGIVMAGIVGAVLTTILK